MIKTHVILIVALCCIGCSENPNPDFRENRVPLSEGDWRFTMNLNGKLLPFNARLQDTDSKPLLTIKNGEESISVENTFLRNDSLIASLPVFNTEIQLRVESSDMVSGHFIDYNRENYRIPLNGEYGNNFRFTSSKSNIDIAQRYRVIFTEKDQTTYPAVLTLSNDSGRVEGTFMTETGDYRYLDGNLMNGGIYLSTFDGSHAFYFQADIEGDSLTNGIFYSGTHYSAEWHGKADANASLSDPESLTTIENHNSFNFKLPNQNGDTVTYETMDLKGKIVIIEIMGTWCPNCLDAARSLASIVKDYDDVVVVPVLFEYQDDIEFARKAYEKFSSKIRFSNKTFLFGGKANKEVALSKFPMLSGFSSFPTIIFLDQTGKVVRIYTGFYGPATGNYYQDFVSGTRALIDSLNRNF